MPPEPWPTALPVAGRDVLVVGGQSLALSPVASLWRAGARVTVVSPGLTDTLRDLADRGHIRWHDRDFSPSDLDAAWMVVAASGDAEIDAAVQGQAVLRRLFCLREDAPGQATAVSGPGRVILVGGGPGAPGLITVRGLEAVRQADVLLVDRLAPQTVLAQVKPGAEIIDVAKIPRGPFTAQDRINQLLIDKARAGHTVVRLKGGDIFVFGRGGEEWEACAAAGIDVELVPGVTSAVAGPGLAGIPVTHRSLSQGFTVVSGHVPPGDPTSTLDWAALARSGTTLVILMGVRQLPAICRALLDAGMDPDTPAATVADAGLPDQRSISGSVRTIADLTAIAGIAAPAIVVIGGVAGFRI